jgi:hypothetical protein
MNWHRGDALKPDMYYVVWFANYYFGLSISVSVAIMVTMQLLYLQASARQLDKHDWFAVLK